MISKLKKLSLEVPKDVYCSSYLCWFEAHCGRETCKLDSVCLPVHRVQACDKPLNLLNALLGASCTLLSNGVFDRQTLFQLSYESFVVRLCNCTFEGLCKHRGRATSMKSRKQNSSGNQQMNRGKPMLALLRRRRFCLFKLQMMDQATVI